MLEPRTGITVESDMSLWGSEGLGLKPVPGWSSQEGQQRTIPAPGTVHRSP